MDGEKNRKKCILSIIAVLVSISILILMFILCGKKNSLHYLKEFAPIATCITAGISAFLSGKNIIVARKLHAEDREAAVFTRWYNELILDRHLDKIEDFYNKCEELVCSFERVNKQRDSVTGNKYDKMLKSDVINPFTISFTTLRKNLVRDLSLINRELSLDISEKLQKLQDDFFSYIDLSHANCFEMQKMIKDSNHSVMRELIKFNKKTAQGKALSTWINE